MKLPVGGVFLVCLMACNPCKSGGCRDAGSGDSSSPSIHTLCNEGRCTSPVRYLSTTTETGAEAAASDFAATLSRMAAAPVEVRGEDEWSPRGVWFLSAQQVDERRLPMGELGFDLSALLADGAVGREALQVRTAADGVYLVGSTSHALRNGAWALLRRFGYRQYFPGTLWEVVPQLERVGGQWNFDVRPPFRMRYLWSGFGVWSALQDDWDDWQAKVGLAHSEQLNSTHAYARLQSRLEAQFAEHPEWRPVDAAGVPTNKLCVFSPGLEETLLDYYLSVLRTEPTRTSVSVEPSDGGGWLSCGTDEDAASVSDRAVTLANFIGDGLQAEFPGRVAAMYAYNEHSPPPTIDVSPNVAVMVATAFIKGEFDELVEGWRERGARIGVRDYWAVNVWDRDRPAFARAAVPARLMDDLRRYESLGIEYISAEASDAFGPLGFGFYKAAMAMYEPDEVSDSVTVERMVATLFSQAPTPMAEFFRLLHSSEARRLSSDLLNKLYTYVDTALRLTTDETERQRIRHFALYVRYIELWGEYTIQLESDRQAAFERLIRFAYRIRDTRMVHSLGLYRDLHVRDRSVEIPEGARWNDPEPSNPWKDSTPFSDAQVVALIRDGISRNPRAPFTPVGYTEELVPAYPPITTELTQYGRGRVTLYRGVSRFKTYRPSGGGAFAVRMTTGVVRKQVAAKNSIEPITVQLHAAASASPDPVFETTVKSTWTDNALTGDAVGAAPSGTEELVCLCSPYGGLHELVVQDTRGAGYTVKTPSGDRWVLEVGPDEPARTGNRWYMYFYVPRGTRVVGVYTRGTSPGDAKLFTSTGRQACLIDYEGPEPCSLGGNKPAGYYGFAVPEGEDGKVWYIKYAANRKFLLTTPIQLAHDPSELLLPRDVVDADGIGGGTLVVSEPPPECAAACD